MPSANNTRIIIGYLMHGDRNIGGGENSIYYLISRLDKDIFKPIVFYSCENSIIKKMRAAGIELVNISLSRELTSVYRNEISTTPLSIINYIKYSVVSIYNIIKEIKSNKIDIFHPHDNLSKIVGGIAAKLIRVPVVSHCRDLLTNNAVDKFLIYYQLLFMSRIIAVSDSNRKLFNIGTFIPSKVVTVYNGIDLVNYSANATNSTETIVIGVIGMFDTCKGHIYLFKAIEQLVSDGYTKIICLVVGDGREERHLKSFVKNHDLIKFIIFLGYRNDVSDLLNDIDILVVPSVQESFPRVILEAMAMKVPVIGTKVGGIPESIEDGVTGIIVSPSSPNGLYDAIYNLLFDQELMIKMGVMGYNRVKKLFSIDMNVRTTEKIYLSLYGSH